MVDISEIPLFQAMQQRMKFINDRQAVLTQNIANANTPNYVPKDLKPVDFSKTMERSQAGVSIKQTHPRHMSPTAMNFTDFQVIEEKNPFEVTPDGNAVVLEEELLKMNTNATDYHTTTSLYRKMTGLLRTAIQGNR